MSKIDYQALREAAQNAKDLGGIKNYKRGEQAVAEFESLITPHIVLASLEAEPVAWKATFTQIDNEYNTFTALYSDKAEVERWVRLHEIGDFRAEITPLYAAPPVQAQGIAIAINELVALSPRLDKQAVETLSMAVAHLRKLVKKQIQAKD
ncbi:hypothetical protein RCM27_11445 [Escherichia marmotae]|nr:hypothetical protein [Escherichia marmotae]